MPLTPTPTTPFSDKIALLGRMLAATAILRTQSGLAADDPDAEEKLLGEASAARRIFYPERDAPLDESTLFPLAIIAPFAGRRYAALGDGAGTSMVHDRGVLLLAALDEDRTPGGTFNLEQSGRAFENFWGALIDQLAAQSGRDWDPLEYPGETLSRLRIAAVEEHQPPQLSAPQDNVVYWAGTALVYYGLWPELELIR